MGLCVSYKLYAPEYHYKDLESYINIQITVQSGMHTEHKWVDYLQSRKFK